MNAPAIYTLRQNHAQICRQFDPETRSCPPVPRSGSDLNFFLKISQYNLHKTRMKIPRNPTHVQKMKTLKPRRVKKNNNTYKSTMLFYRSIRSKSLWPYLTIFAQFRNNNLREA